MDQPHSTAPLKTDKDRTFIRSLSVYIIGNELVDRFAYALTNIPTHALIKQI